MLGNADKHILETKWLYLKNYKNNDESSVKFYPNYYRFK